MKILITGAAGFIGSHIAERLVHEHTVFGIDDYNDYYAQELKRLNVESIPGTISINEASINTKDTVTSLIQDVKPEYIIHCAARAGVRASVQEPLLYSQTNILGTQNILEAVRIHSPGTKCIILSSSSVYGVQETVPFHEEMIPNPQSPYGATKYAMELVVKQYYDFYGVKSAIVRPFSIYGPRGRVDMAPLLIIRSAETGKPFIQFGSNEDNKRDWTYIDDFVDGIISLINNYHFSTFEIFNFGNSHPIGIDDFVEMSKDRIKEYLGKDLEVEQQERSKEELPITYASIKKAMTAIGYEPKISFEEGLQKLYEYYEKNRSLYQHIFS